jgi:hypothetical protein
VSYGDKLNAKLHSYSVSGGFRLAQLIDALEQMEEDHGGDMLVTMETVQPGLVYEAAVREFEGSTQKQLVLR